MKSYPSHSFTLRLVYASLVLASLAVGKAEPAYSLQVASFPSESEAVQLRSSLQATCSPVFVHTDDSVSSSSVHKVLVGRFHSYAEAWAYKAKADPLVVAECFIKRWDAPSGGTSQTTIPLQCGWSVNDLLCSSALSCETLKDVEQVSGFEARTSIPLQVLSTPLAGCSSQQLLQIGFNADHNTSAIAALERYVQNNPSAPEARRAKLAIGWRAVKQGDYSKAHAAFDNACQSGCTTTTCFGTIASANARIKQGNYPAALQKFAALASYTTAPLGIRRHAVQGIAATAHNLKDYPTAWLAFDAARKIAASPAEAAEARMQQAGLVMELVGRGKGTWAEARALCEEAMETSGATREVRATAGLMRAETLLNDELLTTALSSLNSLIDSFPEISREKHTAMALRGVVLCRLNHLAQARQAMQAVLELNIAPDQTFSGNHPKAQALLWLAWMADQPASRSAYVSQLKQNYPGSPQVVHAARLFEYSPQQATTSSLQQ